MISLSEQKQPVIFLLFLVTAVGLRFFSFFPSVLDHDESTYMIIGRDILNGKSLYTDVTDTKPVGIFLFYAGLEFLFGSSIFWKRFVFALIVGLTAFLIFKASKKFFENRKVAFASGIVYIFYTSVWNYHGRSPNTELLFNLFTIVGLLLFLNRDFRSYFLGGLSLGVGFMVKYLVLFDLFAFLLFFFIVDLKDRNQTNIREIVARYALACFAFLIPFGAVNLYFWLGNNFHDFYFVTYQLPGNYGSNPSLTRYFTMLADFVAKFLPVSMIVFYVAFQKNKPMDTRLKRFFLLWIAAVLFAIYLPGKEFSHYTIQLMLPLSIIAGVFFHPRFKKDRLTAVLYSGKVGIVLLTLVVLVIQFLGFKDEYMKTDYPREVASYITAEGQPGDQVYISNYQQIIYYLLGQDAPTKFVHSNLLFTETSKAFDVDADGELKRIMETDPEFVVVQRKNEKVEELLGIEYRLAETFNNGKISVYRRF
jgi:4-amino-4-deoxy-L-arabinose transferase-like glycosyltransferase